MSNQNNQSAAYSSLKIFYHTDKIKDLIEGKRTTPLYVRIKPTNVCNMKCFYCSYSDLDVATNNEANPDDFIEWPVMEQILNDLKSMDVKAITYSGGGEPLCYKYIKQAMALTLRHGLDLSMITNGLLLNDDNIEYLKHAKWVRISLDAAKPETYKSMRGVSSDALDKVFANIQKLRQAAPNCEIGINYVINHQNHNEIYEAAKKAKYFGCNHIKFAARILTHGFEEYHKDFKQTAINMLHQAIDIYEDKSFSVVNKYETDFEYDKENARKYVNCPIKEIKCVIAADSKIYYCQDKAYKPDSVVGDIKIKSFKDIWFSEDVAERYRNFDASKECPGHCVGDERNILMNSLLYTDKKHINFI